MAEPLKPCPFCGGKAIILESAEEDSVLCTECGVRASGFPHLGDLTTTWNRRELDSSLRILLRHVERHVKGCVLADADENLHAALDEARKRK